MNKNEMGFFSRNKKNNPTEQWTTVNTKNEERKRELLDAISTIKWSSIWKTGHNQTRLNHEKEKKEQWKANAYDNTLFQINGLQRQINAIKAELAKL